MGVVVSLTLVEEEEEEEAGRTSGKKRRLAICETCVIFYHAVCGMTDGMYWLVLQCGAICCSVLQCVAVCWYTAL